MPKTWATEEKSFSLSSCPLSKRIFPKVLSHRSQPLSSPTPPASRLTPRRAELKNLPPGRHRRRPIGLLFLSPGGKARSELARKPHHPHSSHVTSAPLSEGVRPLSLPTIAPGFSPTEAFYLPATAPPPPARLAFSGCPGTSVGVHFHFRAAIRAILLTYLLCDG